MRMHLRSLPCSKPARARACPAEILWLPTRWGVCACFTHNAAPCRSNQRLESLFEGCVSASPQDELARLFVMDKLTGMGAKNLSSGNLLGDRLGMSIKPKGKFDAQSGKWYRSAKVAPHVVQSVGLQDLMEALNEPAIKFDSQSQQGVVFNIVPSDGGGGMELSLMCIGDTHVDVDSQLQTALSKVKELLAANESSITADSVAGFSMFQSQSGEPAVQLGDAQDSCSGMTLFAPPADRQQPGDVTIENACGMSMFTYAPAAKESKKRGKKLGETACEFAVQDSLNGMSLFEKPAGWTAPTNICATNSQAGMTMFAPEGPVKPPADDVTLDSVCGMGMFSWKMEGMDEVEISRALSQASTRGGQDGSFKSSYKMTPVGSMSSVVSALNDDDVLELMEGFAGFTFFNRAPNHLVPEDELVAAESSAGMTLFARSNSRQKLYSDVSAESCMGLSMFSMEDATQ